MRVWRRTASTSDRAVAGPGRSADPDAVDLGAAIDAVASYVASFDPARYSVGDCSVLVGRFARLKRLAAAGEALCATRAASPPDTGSPPDPPDAPSQFTLEE